MAGRILVKMPPVGHNGRKFFSVEGLIQWINFLHLNIWIVHSITKPVELFTNYLNILRFGVKRDNQLFSLLHLFEKSGALLCGSVVFVYVLPGPTWLNGLSQAGRRNFFSGEQNGGAREPWSVWAPARLLWCPLCVLCLLFLAVMTGRQNSNDFLLR